MKLWKRNIHGFGFMRIESTLLNIAFPNFECLFFWMNLTDCSKIISISDKSAAQIITKLKNKKINVPKKIRVVGFGNEFVGEMLDPKLTTFDTQTRHIGEESSATH